MNPQHLAKILIQRINLLSLKVETSIRRLALRPLPFFFLTGQYNVVDHTAHGNHGVH